jgi:hypothetical protein
MRKNRRQINIESFGFFYQYKAILVYLRKLVSVNHDGDRGINIILIRRVKARTIMRKPIFIN